MPATDLTSLPHALEHLDQILAEIADRLPAVFLDYDGTLTPIVDDPNAARLSAAGRRALTRLAHCCPVAIISGRDLADVQTMVGLDGLVMAGSHGFDIAGPGWAHQHEAGLSAVPALRSAARELERALDGVSGALVERKQFAVTVHFRRVQEAGHEQVAAAVDAVARGHPELRRTGGKMIHELRPDLDWHKGHALRFLVREMHLDGVVSIYVGDDETDEDALRAVGPDGIGVVVGSEARPTEARFRVDDPGQVIELLEAIAAWLEGRATH